MKRFTREGTTLLLSAAGVCPTTCTKLRFGFTMAFLEFKCNHHEVSE
jgi:hypothetical protein